MVFDTTYKDKRIDRAITELCGRPISFFNRLRMRGNGSQKFVIRSASPELDQRVCRQFNLKHCNIELRRQGVLVRFGSFARTFAWAIPYHQLTVVKNHCQLTIYGGTLHMSIADAFGGKIDPVFLDKMLQFKAEQVLTSFEQSGNCQ